MKYENEYIKKTHNNQMKNKIWQKEINSKLNATDKQVLK